MSARNRELAQEPAEQARLKVQEQEKEAARLLAMAKAKRDEESELADGLARLRRERGERVRARSRRNSIGESPNWSSSRPSVMKRRPPSVERRSLSDRPPWCEGKPH
ncbi:MAG: hypothetical protein IPF41_16935 [Flavobacteriales bacterium]|nr:hypothetical protein [Flavobacteriales bacterium]